MIPQSTKSQQNRKNKDQESKWERDVKKLSNFKRNTMIFNVDKKMKEITETYQKKTVGNLTNKNGEMIVDWKYLKTISFTIERETHRVEKCTIWLHEGMKILE